MLPGDPIVAARKLLSDEVTAQHQRFVEGLANLLREYDDRGALKSTDTLMEGTLICCSMLQDRVEIFSKALNADNSVGCWTVWKALESKQIAGMAEAHYAMVAPHMYCGPVAAAAAIQLDVCSPNF